jgi:ZIP family zinc transporter
MANAVAAGCLASLGTGLATGLGALPVLGLRRADAVRDRAFMAFAGGVMLAASIFSLILPAIRAAQAQGMSTAPATAAVLGVTLIGAGAMALLGRWLPAPEGIAEAPHTSGDALTSTGPCRSQPGLPRPVWVLCLAIVVHNIPEGAAVGMAFSGSSASGGLATAVGIGLQNLPEGLAVACALASTGMPPHRAFIGGAASGMVEPVAGAGGAVLVALVQRLLPWGLALAAGAMLLIVLHQILPDIIRHRRERTPSYRRATAHDLPAYAFAGGMAIMGVLDVTLG